MKRLLYAFGVLAFIALIIYIGYLLRYRSGDTGTPTDTTNDSKNGGAFPSDSGSGNGSQNGGLESGGNNGGDGSGSGASGELSVVDRLQKVSDQPVSSFFVEASGTIIAVHTDGRIIRLNGDSVEVLSAAPIPSLLTSSFSATGKRAMVTIGSGTSKQFSVFNVEEREWAGFLGDAEEAVWGPEGENVAFLGRGADRAYRLTTHDLSQPNRAPRVLTSLPAEDLAIVWISPTKISIAEKSSAKTVHSAWLYDIQRGTLTPSAREIGGLMINWDPAGTQALAFGTLAAVSGSGDFWIQNSVGAVLDRFFLKTLPQKCVFEKDRFYNSTSSTSSVVAMPWRRESDFVLCGVPRGNATFSQQNLPDAYLQRALYTEDDLLRVNLRNGNIEIVWIDDNTSVDVTAPKVSGNALYFIDRCTNKLYRLSFEYEAEGD